MRKRALRKARDQYIAVSSIGADSDNEWIRKSASIGGWLFEGEHEFLWDLACRSSEGDIAEIGSWMGKSTCILAGACAEAAPGTKVLCVDPFDMSGTDEQEEYHRSLVDEEGTFYLFTRNARELGFANFVIPIAARSGVAIPLLPRDLRMAFVDGTHDYEGVRADVELLLPKLASGGVLALHDALNPVWKEIGRFVDEELTSDPRVSYLETVNTIVAFEKVAGH